MWAWLMQGWHDEDLDAGIWQMREELITSSPDLVLFDTAKKHAPTGKVRLHAPPRLPMELSLAIRDAAAKLFKVGTTLPVYCLKSM